MTNFLIPQTDETRVEPRHMDTFGGLRVILSEYLVEDGEPYEARRSWRERLFSRPWRPFQATYTVVPKIPKKGGYQMSDAIVLHPETWRAMQKARLHD